MRLVEDSSQLEKLDNKLGAAVQDIDGLFEVGRYSFEGDSVRQSLKPLAGFAASVVTSKKCGVLLNLHELRVWPNNHEPVIINCFFDSLLADPRGLPPDKTSYHLGVDETDTVRACLLLAMWFGWTIALTGCGRIPHLEINHDGMMKFYAKSSNDWLAKEFARSTSRNLIN